MNVVARRMVARACSLSATGEAAPAGYTTAWHSKATKHAKEARRRATGREGTIYPPKRFCELCAAMLVSRSLTRVFAVAGASALKSPHGYIARHDRPGHAEKGHPARGTSAESDRTASLRAGHRCASM